MEGTISYRFPWGKFRLSPGGANLREKITTTYGFLLCFLVMTLVTATTAAAQTLIGTVDTGGTPIAAAANRATNQIYVANYCGNGPTCVSNGTVTVIDGATLKTTTVNVGLAPYQAAVNTVTNKIYVANSGGNTVTVIDGATNNTTPVTVGNRPQGLAVNPVTNEIYVPNSADNTVTVIDGATLAT